MAIGHLDFGRQIVVVDCIREVTPPFNPSQVVEQFARTLASYNIGVVHGDKYGGLWPTEAFDKVSIRYEQLGRTKSDCYHDLLPVLNSGRIHLLDHPKTINQICSLERRVARGGKDSIDHPPGAGFHDDCANAVAILCSILTQQHQINYAAWSDTTADNPDAAWSKFVRDVYYQSHGTVRVGPFGYG
jgi:hypothetical protein